METLIVGERGQITIPRRLREKYSIKPKQPVVIEDRDGEIVIKPAVVVSLDRLKALVEEYDEEVLQEILESNKISPQEEERIFKKRLSQED